MAEKKILSVLLMCGIFCLLFGQYAGAAGTIDVELQQNITNMTPVYVDGHDGQIDWIAGFSFESDLSIGPAPLGTMSGSYMTAQPPMSLTSLFEDFIFTGTMSLPGYGTCELTGNGTAMTASAQGDIVIGFSGRMDSCTDSLTGIAAISYGTASANIFLATGESTFILRIPKP